MLTRPHPTGRSAFAPAQDWQAAAHPGRTTLALLAAGVLALALFRLFPALDLWATGLFHDGADCPRHLCEQFPLATARVWTTFREVGLLIPRIVLIAAVVWLFWSLFHPRLPTVAAVAKPLLGILSAIIGPVLIVNAVLKEHWGRPRPFQTDDFGGDGTFVAPGSLSTQCDSNCSFVSGEAAAAFWLVWLVFVVPERWRRPTLAVTLILATSISLLRMAFGRHYLSDITMSALIATASVTGTLWLLQSKTAQRAIDDWIHWIDRYVRR